MRQPIGKYLVIWFLVLLTVWVGQQLYRDLFLTVAEPRAVTPRGSLADFERQNIEVFETIAPSVAYIFTRSGGSAFNTHSPGSGAGSGFIWDRAGHIVTNHHVVAGASEVAVRLESGDAIRAAVVGAAPDYDLAVLRLKRLPGGLQPIPIGTSADLQVGQAVLAIGNPFGLSRTLTTGIISALDRRLPADTGREIAGVIQTDAGVIQTDAAINPGNSGGPLLDSAGRLIGVNTAIISGSGSSADIGFAVPVDVVNRIVPQVIANGKAVRPGIGISTVPEETAARLGIEGIIIFDVAPGGSAEAAGLRGVDQARGTLGDVITEIDGHSVRTIAELAEALERVGVGNAATVTVVRNRQSFTASVDVIDIS